GSLVFLGEFMDGRVQPWYGSWPPELKGEAGMRLGKFNVPIWVIMLVLFAASLAAWAYVDYLKGTNHYFLLEIFGRLFEAMAIASILGATIDGFLKVAIVKDVFEVSLGYLLPQQLRPHMRWIY